MGQYCDSQALERNWYNWILSSSVPLLEPYRKAGVLWTKVLGRATHNGKLLLAHGKPLPDPSHPVRRHCLALATPLFFETKYGELPQNLMTTGRCLGNAPEYFEIRREILLMRPVDDLVANKSRDPNLDLDLWAIGYDSEPPEAVSWHAVLEDIRKICNGIVTKFHMPSEEEQLDLASDALLQITKKLVAGKLVYMPGRAPVFNLLTTTTYRIIYSILNKRNSQKENIRKFIDDAAAGVLPTAGRSIRVPHSVLRRNN